MKLISKNFTDGALIPTEFAFGKTSADSPCILSNNRNPHLAWSDVPENTKSFVLICIDCDVPTRGHDVNQVGRTVSASLPRTDFVHWVMIDIPAACREIISGSCSNGIIPHGKQYPPGPTGSKQGINDYTSWFANDPEMAGDYYGYDGPCPPWNDELIHHYHFRLYALDTSTIGLYGRFTATEVLEKINAAFLAKAELMGTYTLNATVL